LRMQASYDLWHASRDLESEIEHVSIGAHFIKRAAAVRRVPSGQRVGGLRVAARAPRKPRGPSKRR
jgi:hypothetical protein